MDNNTISKKELYDEWVEIASTDYEAGKKMYDEHWKKQNYIICYLCQQAVEKYLKGYLAYQEEAIVKTHILNALIDLCIKYDKDFDILRDKCSYLTQFSVQIRYPGATLDITEIEAKNSLDYAKVIIDFVSDKMKDKE